MELEEIREHRAKAQQEIATAITEILRRLKDTTGLAAEGLTVEGAAHWSSNRVDMFVVTSVKIDLGTI